jgi:hypothetical protein
VKSTTKVSAQVHGRRNAPAEDGAHRGQITVGLMEGDIGEDVTVREPSRRK